MGMATSTGDVVHPSTGYEQVIEHRNNGNSKIAAVLNAIDLAPTGIRYAKIEEQADVSQHDLVAIMSLCWNEKLIESRKEGTTNWYMLTDAGRERLRELETPRDLAPYSGKDEPAKTGIDALLPRDEDEDEEEEDPDELEPVSAETPAAPNDEDETMKKEGRGAALSPETVAAVKADVEGGMAVKKAAKKNKIAYSTACRITKVGHGKRKTKPAAKKAPKKQKLNHFKIPLADPVDPPKAKDPADAATVEKLSGDLEKTTHSASAPIKVDWELNLKTGETKTAVTFLEPPTTLELAKLVEKINQAILASDIANNRALVHEEDDLHEIVQACYRIIHQRVLKAAS